MIAQQKTNGAENGPLSGPRARNVKQRNNCLCQLVQNPRFPTSYKENLTDENKEWKKDWPGANRSGGSPSTGRLHFRRPLASAERRSGHPCPRAAEYGYPSAACDPVPGGADGVGGSGCGITLDGDTSADEAIELGGQDAYVAGGKCSISGDSIDVVFENTDADNKLPLVVYTTGGEDFPSVQALVADGDEDADKIPDAAGEVGVGEHLLTISERTDDFGNTVRGAETITVTRSMAGDDGKVYLFGYFNSDDPDRTPQQFLIDGMFDVNRDGVISGDDDRVRVPSALRRMRKSSTANSTS